METQAVVALVAVAVAVHVALAAFTYYDASALEMANPRRWAAIVLAVPIYGVIVYLLTRSELDYDPETDPYAGGKVNVHPSRADEVPWDVRDGGTGDDSRPDDDGREWNPADERTEWNEPVDVEDLEDATDGER